MINVVPPIGGSGNDLCSTGNTVWTFTLTNGAQFLPNTTYAVTISAQDPNGSALVPGLAANPFNFTVNAAPWISVPTLSAAGCLDASTTISISWTMTDQEESATSLTVLLSFWNNRSQWETITGPRQGFASSASTPWTLPRTDVTTRVRLEVTDSGGVTNMSESVWFRIDTGPPTVGSTSPLDGAKGVATNSTISASFYEEMDQPTVEAA